MILEYVRLDEVPVGDRYCLSESIQRLALHGRDPVGEDRVWRLTDYDHLLPGFHLLHVPESGFLSDLVALQRLYVKLPDGISGAVADMMQGGTFR